MRKSLVLSLCLLLIASAIVIPTPSKALEYSMDGDLSKVDASFWGENAGDWSGRRVAIVGDVNADGFDDILIGSNGNAESGSYAGQAYLLFGSSSGWAMDTDLSKSDASFKGENAGDIAGDSVAGAGDVNGDGIDDILIGASGDDDGGTDAGQVYLFFGKKTGWAMDTNLSAANASFWGEKAGDFAGNSVAGAGDVNGDGYDDLLIGAYQNDDTGSNAGQTYLIFGKSSGWAMDKDLSTADASFLGEVTVDYAGSAIAGGGDVNNDGYDDILIGAYSNDEGGLGAGQTYLILGKSSGWSIDTSLSKANASFWGENAGDLSGCSLAMKGDVNADGYDDILIGAYSNDEIGLDAGQTFLVLGRSSGWAMDIKLSMADATFLGENAGDFSGYSVANDGDVNGDGYDDILIGADRDNVGGAYSGQSYLVLGKGSGWARDRSLSTADASFWGENANDYSGTWVTNGGDVNGDGYDDFLIGALWNAEAGTEAGQTYLVFPDSNSKPLSVQSVSTFNDSGYTQVTNTTLMNATLFVELRGIDGNASRRDIAIVNVTSERSSPNGIMLRLMETAIGTGVYRGKFTLADHNRPQDHLLKASAGETIHISCVEDPTKNVSVWIFQPVDLVPNLNKKYHPEDTPLNIHFYSQAAEPKVWQFKTNAQWLGWNATSQNLSGTPNNGDVGSYWVWLKATSDHLLSDELNFSMIVNNTAPSIKTSNILTVQEDDEYFNNYQSDDEDLGNTQWHLMTNATWLTINSTFGLLNGTPQNKDVGHFWVNVSIDDGNGGTNYTNFTLTVTNVNDLPVITTVPPLVATEDIEYRVVFNATDVDIGDRLTWKLFTNASWLSINEPTGILNGTPDNADVGRYNVTVWVSDGHPMSNDSLYYTLEVLNVNDPPFWVDAPQNSTILDTEVYSFDVNATDIDVGDVLTFGLTKSPAGMTID